MHLDLIRWRKGMIRQPFDPLMGQGLGAPRPWGSRSKSPPKVGRAVSPSDEIVHQLSDHLCCRQITPDRNRAVQSRITTCLRQKSTKNLNAAWGKGKGEPKVNCPARRFSAPSLLIFRDGGREIAKDQALTGAVSHITQLAQVLRELRVCGGWYPSDATRTDQAQILGDTFRLPLTYRCGEDHSTVGEHGHHD